MRILRVFILLFFLSCSDIPDSELRPRPTEMKVRVIDEDFDPVEDGEVYLYRDYISFQTKTGEVAQSTIAFDGFAYFTDLEPYNYFIYATHSDNNKVYDNSQYAYNLYDYLTENATTSITVKTNFLRDSEPDSVLINRIDIIPLNTNSSWTGKDYDTLRGEFLIIKNYDWLLDISEQTIVARTTFEVTGKEKFGEILSLYPTDDNFEYLDMALDSLQSNWDDLVDPDRSTYTLYISCFAGKSDFMNRDQIYSGDLTATDYHSSEEIYLSAGLLDASTQDNPFPQLTFLEQTHYQKINYLIFANTTWK